MYREGKERHGTGKRMCKGQKTRYRREWGFNKTKRKRNGKENEKETRKEREKTQLAVIITTSLRS